MAKELQFGKYKNGGYSMDGMPNPKKSIWLFAFCFSPLKISRSRPLEPSFGR
jgi:hypothetical protein